MWQWQSRYEPPDCILDGTQWQLQLAHAGQSLNTSGDNAYPLNPLGDPLINIPFNRFIIALVELTGFVELQDKCIHQPEDEED